MLDFGELLPLQPPKIPAHQLPPAALAYFGDAVYELFIRWLFLTPPQRINTYHRQVVAHVRAESQARYMDFLWQHCTETERAIFRQGRNAATDGPKRVAAKIYRQATGFEALLGYLYLSNPQRLQEIFQLLEGHIRNQMNGSIEITESRNEM
ncbi:MAG: mini-ribonuclease 3 [Thermosynechococcus sp.]|uniref:Mini-ribonuclease 3 n=1 Tax=Thermosynechococcus sp. TaxID=2814275 RepID=UPI002205F252|nr:ribonuclease III domain-containing protein [Thermosynechococcus sp.]BCX11360.1 MAG: mini-ribonuclease 3 [Thermosynechococcus sp.]